MALFSVSGRAKKQVSEEISIVYAVIGITRQEGKSTSFHYEIRWYRYSFKNYPFETPDKNPKHFLNGHWKLKLKRGQGRRKCYTVKPLSKHFSTISRATSTSASVVRPKVVAMSSKAKKFPKNLSVYQCVSSPFIESVPFGKRKLLHQKFIIQQMWFILDICALLKRRKQYIKLQRYAISKYNNWTVAEDKVHCQYKGQPLQQPICCH